MPKSLSEPALEYYGAASSMRPLVGKETSLEVEDSNVPNYEHPAAAVSCGAGKAGRAGRAGRAALGGSGG